MSLVGFVAGIGNQMDGQLPSQTHNVVSKDFGVEISSFGFSVVYDFGVFRDVWPYQYVLNLKWPESILNVTTTQGHFTDFREYLNFSRNIPVSSVNLETVI